MIEPAEEKTKGFTITLTLGPFIVGDPEPVWADVTAMVLAECRREWEARNLTTSKVGDTVIDTRPAG